jgi:hypothetical protein
MARTSMLLIKLSVSYPFATGETERQMGGMRSVPRRANSYAEKDATRVDVNSDFSNLGGAVPFSEMMSHQVRIRRSIEAATSLVFLS